MPARFLIPMDKSTRFLAPWMRFTNSASLSEMNGGVVTTATYRNVGLTSNEGENQNKV